MDLWIRSQDKRQLLKVNDGLFIANGFTDTDDTFIGIKNVGHVGKYTEEKRALEVLDEIQNILNPKYMIRMDGNLNNVEKFLNIDGAYIKSQDNADIKIINNSYVYEMPKDDE